MIYIITSVDNVKIKEIIKLKQKKYRDLYNKYIIEGENLVLEAFKNNLLEEIFILDDYNLDIKKTIITPKIMKQLTELPSIPSIIGIAKKTNKNLIKNKILILENIQDPGNIGTIIRTAVALNIETIILTKTCADIYSPKVLRSTQGMIYNINILVDDIENIIKNLKQKNIKIYGTDVNEGNLLNNIKKPEKFAIIMGNEGQGLKKETKNQCDEFIYIKMNENCESLNVAVASSIIMYEFSKE